MDEIVRQYLSTIGSKGGKLSRRTLSAVDARAMLRVREARRAFRRFHTLCFWSYDPNYLVKLSDIPWVVEKLMKNGNRQSWEVATRLCR